VETHWVALFGSPAFDREASSNRQRETPKIIAELNAMCLSVAEDAKRGIVGHTRYGSVVTETPSGGPSQAEAPAKTAAPSGGWWIVKVAVALALVLMAWATFGSSWYFDGKAQICSPAGRAFSTPDMPCYQPPPPGCTGSPLSSTLCVNESYRGMHRYFNDDVVGRGIDWIFERLDFYVVPTWNAFLMSETNRNIGAGLLAAVLFFVFKKLGEDVWEYLKATEQLIGPEQTSTSSRRAA
jgi:hypothetical protein